VVLVDLDELAAWEALTEPLPTSTVVFCKERSVRLRSVTWGQKLCGGGGAALRASAYDRGRASSSAEHRLLDTFSLTRCPVLRSPPPIPP
jgi:hypothetical protein